MKLLMILFLFVPIIAFSQSKKPNWDYPVKPGSEEWKSFKNYDSKVRACQIPVDVLNKLKTADLLCICLDYPLLPAVYAFNNVNDGFSKFENDFNGFRALLERQDAGNEIAKLYKEKFPEEIEIKKTLIDKGAYIVQLSLIELFISHLKIIEQLSVAEKKDLLRELLAKKDKKKLNSMWDTRLGFQLNYLAMINIVNSGNINRINIDDKVLTFIYYGMNEAPETKEEIEKIANNYLNNN